MLTLLAKKEVLEWLKGGQKIIDVRKGRPKRGDRVLFVSGPYKLEMKITGCQSGRLSELVQSDNYKLVIPSAGSVEEAWAYLRRFYGDYDGVYTAYSVER